jgi:type IV secretion system protein VirB4
VFACSPLRTLTDLEIRLQDDSLRQALRPYTLQGTFGSLFDANSDGLLDGCFLVFEMSHLMEMLQETSP